MLSGCFNIISFLDVILVPTWVHFSFQNPQKIVTWRCLRRVLGRLGGVLGRLVASWKCLGASEDSNYSFLKVKNLKILIFEGFSEFLGGGRERGAP